MYNDQFSYPPRSAPSPSPVDYNKLSTLALQEAEASFQGWQQDAREAFERVSALQAELQGLNQKLIQTSIQAPFRFVHIRLDMETRATELSAEWAGHFKAMEDADAARQLLLEAVSNSRLALEAELKDCQSKLSAAEDRARLLEMQDDAMRTISDKLKTSQAACTQLQAQLNIERMLSPNEMRQKLAFVESDLEKEKALLRSKAQLSAHWEKIGSHLRRHLDEAKAELLVEQTARRALQTQLNTRMWEEASAAQSFNS
jgi:CRISPR/Cas system CMR-associated protein Cmr5 small subunit